MPRWNSSQITYSYGGASNYGGQNRYGGNVGAREQSNDTGQAKYSTARSKNKPQSQQSQSTDVISEYADIKARLSKHGQLYEDPDFHAVDRSIFYSRSPPRPFEWKRPSVRNFIVLADPLY